jgi:putative endonuclease
MTSNLRKRVLQHKNHIYEGFSDDYNCTRLVYWESFDDVAYAIDREKQLKRWRREKKEWLIVRKNPHWQDLAADWYETERRVETITSLSSRAKYDGARSASSYAVEGPCVLRCGETLRKAPRANITRERVDRAESAPAETKGPLDYDARSLT